MTAENINSSVGKRLSDDGQVTAEEIDSMEVGELAHFLSSNGIDVAKLNERIPSLKEKFENQLRFHRAKCAPTSPDDETIIDIETFSEEQIVTALVELYGSLDNVPLAARNFKEFSIHEWRSLYRDLILGKD